LPPSFRTRALVALLALALPGAAGATALAKPAAQDAKGGASFTYALPGDRVFPEGIAVDRGEGRFYVSSTTDGTIVRGPIRGRSAGVFLPGGADGRTTAVGLKADRGRLFVAGGATGTIWVYDLRTRALVRRFETGTGGFLNDVAIAPNGDAYVTDSQRPFVFRVRADELGAGAPGTTVALTPFLTYPNFQAGAFNANGIVAVDRRTLVYVQSVTGRLFRVDLRTQSVQAIDLGGATVTAGDGLVLGGRTLYVVRNSAGVIAKVRLSVDVRSGRVVSETTDPTFRYPTTAAEARGRLLVVNAQFDKRTAGQPPELPFTVSSIRRP
jgi:sugar lactone lactonase YvrE